MSAGQASSVDADVFRHPHMWRAPLLEGLAQHTGLPAIVIETMAGQAFDPVAFGLFVDMVGTALVGLGAAQQQDIREPGYVFPFCCMYTCTPRARLNMPTQRKCPQLVSR